MPAQPSVSCVCSVGRSISFANWRCRAGVAVWSCITYDNTLSLLMGEVLPNGLFGVAAARRRVRRTVSPGTAR